MYGKCLRKVLNLTSTFLHIPCIYSVDPSCDGEPSKKELWKTASLDRNPLLNQPHIVKRYDMMLCPPAFLF